MSHFVRERNERAWYRGLKIPHTVFRGIDEKTKKAVSGSGGTYAPGTPIIIGGEGLELQCLLQLAGAPIAYAKPGAGKVFRFGDDDYFTNDALVSRKINDSPLLILGNHSLQREARAVGLVAGFPGLQTKHPGAFLRLPLRLPDGARLSQVVVSFRVGQSHANVPDYLPKARVVRIAPEGTITQYPEQTTSGRDVNGWVPLATPGSGALYYAAGASQTITLTFDHLAQDPTSTAAYGYALEWTEESGSNTFADSVGNYLDYIETTFYQADLRPY